MALFFEGHTFHSFDFDTCDFFWRLIFLHIWFNRYIRNKYKDENTYYIKYTQNKNEHL